MTTYLQPKLGRLAAHRQRRTSYAEEARSCALPATLYSIEHIIAAARTDAAEERRSFRDDFGTDLPVHLDYALRTEDDAWERLEGGIVLFAQADAAPGEIATYAGNVRTYLTHQLDLLGLEQEMVYSCLTDHYVQQIADLWLRLAGVRL
ncbi:MAG TPA: hypothetical protein VGO08_16460 [Burkholderiales bacterium]|nr:hypothetical protein [Burkholderiales bacterium]